MKKVQPYFEHPGKVAEADERFKHVMAITLNPRSGYQEGIIRCIVSRTGNIMVKGYIDRSVLHKIRGNLERFDIHERLIIKNEVEITGRLGGKDWDFIGLEDPDIFIIDEKTGLMHVYFTIPLKPKIRIGNKHTLTHLGHAFGKDLDSLEMTVPVLMADKQTDFKGAKEVSIAPLNRQGFRYNLVESGKREQDFYYSIVRVAVAEDMGRAWKFGEIAFHPKEHGIPWIAGHASPGPLLPKTFIDVGKGKMLGILNGREANQKINGETKYGMFSVGLFVYDYENGKIEWVSLEPFIQDSQAKTITFASQFVEMNKGVGILYAHVDDSFVRAYTLNADSIKSLLP